MPDKSYPEGVTSMDHVNHDLKMGRFPNVSSVETFLKERAVLAAQEHVAHLLEIGGGASEPEFGKWHPIETLPKDGKKVMLYRPLADESNDPVITIRRTTKTSQHCWPDTIPPGCDGQNFTEGCFYATHWMPLPPPPSPTSQTEE